MPIRAALARHFGGNLVPYRARSSNPRTDPYEIGMRTVAMGPRLDQGKSTYLLYGNSEQFGLDPLKNAARDGRSPGYSPQSFRPAFLTGERPYALVANRNLGVASIEALLSLALRRAAAGNHLLCAVGGHLGASFAHRFTNLTKAQLMLEVNMGGDVFPQNLEGIRNLETAIVLVGPMLFSSAVQGRVNVVTVLATEGQPIISREFGKVTIDDGIPRIPRLGPLASLGFAPSCGFFVSADEDDRVVEALFQSFRAASTDPVMRNEHAHLVPLGFTSLEATSRRYAAEVARYEQCAAASRC
jgi:hypothetical protein